MTKVVPITLSDAEAALVESQLEAGRYASAEAVIHAGLALLAERATARDRAGDAPDGTVLSAALPGRPLTLDELRAEIRKGEESGPAQDFDFDAWLEGKNRAHGG